MCLPATQTIITPSNALLVYCDVTTAMNRIVKEVKLGHVFLPHTYLSILLGLQNILVKVRGLSEYIITISLNPKQSNFSDHSVVTHQRRFCLF